MKFETTMNITLSERSLKDLNEGKTIESKTERIKIIPPAGGYDADSYYNLSEAELKSREEIFRLMMDVRRVMKDFFKDNTNERITLALLNDAIALQHLSQTQIESCVTRMRQEGEIYSLKIIDGEHQFRFTKEA